MMRFISEVEARSRRAIHDTTGYNKLLRQRAMMHHKDLRRFSLSD
jgi:hypothetical protein